MQPLTIIPLVLLFGLAAITQPMTAEAQDILLCVEGVEGGSQVEDPSGCIDVQSWNWGTETPIDLGGGRQQGSSQVQPLVVFKEIDVSSAPLLLGSLQVKSYPKASLIVRSCPGGCDSAPVPVVTIVMENLFISRVDMGSTAGTQITESFALVFERLEYCYQAINEDASPGREVCIDYDIEGGV